MTVAKDTLVIHYCNFLLQLDVVVPDGDWLGHLVSLSLVPLVAEVDMSVLFLQKCARCGRSRDQYIFLVVKSDLATGGAFGPLSLNLRLV